MPELPEVHTTTSMLDGLISGLTIKAVWTDYNSSHHAGKDNIKDPLFFKKFEKAVVGTQVASVTRRGKNVLIHLHNNYTVLVHMKMTGHLLYGKYQYKNEWHALEPEALKDPFNRFVHFVISFSNGRHLALSDVRKFAKVTLLPTPTLAESDHLKDTGPEPLETAFDFKKFQERLHLRPRGKIKQVLMDPKIIAGIGNIYSDEILWASRVHPHSIVQSIPKDLLKILYTNSKVLLKKGIHLGGDSTSDYRNPLGEHGKFHYEHKAYQNTGKACTAKGCHGIIQRLKVGGRNAHFCPTHQHLFNN